MARITSSVWAGTAVLGAAAVAWLTMGRAPAADPLAPATPATAVSSVAPPVASAEPLPPSVAQGGADLADFAPEAHDDLEPLGITWSVPGEWKQIPNANEMRLATYRVAEDVTLTVTRSGGSLDANIARWVEQFSGAKVDRRQKAAYGLDITLVRIEGTFVGAGGLRTPRPGQTLSAAIVDVGDGRIFFELFGPAAPVSAARTGFDGLVDSMRRATSARQP